MGNGITEFSSERAFELFNLFLRDSLDWVLFEVLNFLV